VLKKGLGYHKWLYSLSYKFTILYINIVIQYQRKKYVQYLTYDRRSPGFDKWQLDVFRVGLGLLAATITNAK
jgi:hypothetical protein